MQCLVCAARAAHNIAVGPGEGRRTDLGGQAGAGAPLATMLEVQLPYFRSVGDSVSKARLEEKGEAVCHAPGELSSCRLEIC